MTVRHRNIYARANRRRNRLFDEVRFFRARLRRGIDNGALLDLRDAAGDCDDHARLDDGVAEHAAEHPALTGQFEEVTAGANLLFRVDGCYPQKDDAIRAAWQSYRESSDPDAVRMQCLVTGREDEITATHPAIKGVRNAQSSGAALVSFNAPALQKLLLKRMKKRQKPNRRKKNLRKS